MNLMSWVYQLDLVTLVPAILVALGLSLIPAVRAHVGATAEPATARGARPDRTIKTVLVAAAALVILTSFAAQVEWLLYPFFSLGAPPPYEFRWYEFAREMLVGCVALLVVILVYARSRRTPRAAVPPSGPRTWRTFAPKAGTPSLITALAALTLFTVFAGSLSSVDGDGRFTMLTISTGGAISGGSGSFYGWSYGIPTVLTALVFAGLTFASLHSNAARPFLEPQTVSWELQSRRALATRTLWFSTGVLIYTLGACVLRVGLAAAGQVSTPEFAWGTGISSLEPMLIWGGRLLRAAGFSLLFLVIFTNWARQPHRHSDARSSSASQDATTDAGPAAS